MFGLKEGSDKMRDSRSILRILAFSTALFATALLSAAADIPCTWTGVERVVAVGDLHGDYDRFITILQSKEVGVVDADLHWIGGKTHLVQTGDILDRGTRAKDILDLLKRLEKEASDAGGMVHVLLGNHEEITIARISLGYPDYVTIEQFVSFLPPDFRKAREKDYIAGLSAEAKARVEANGLDLVYDRGLRLFWTTLMRRDDVARSAYYDGFNAMYGKWILRKNAVIKINDIVFTHGGICREYSTWKLREINDLYRTELGFLASQPRIPYRFGRRFKPEIVYKPDAPLWYRTDEIKSPAEIDRILANLGAKAMVVGHSFLRSGGGSPAITPDASRLFGGKLWMIDTGISSSYGGVLSALLINNGDIHIWEPGEEPEARSPVLPPQGAPPATRAEIEDFLKSATVTGSPRPAAEGRTEPWKIILEASGVQHRAQFKYINRRRPNPLPDSYQYELAAYELNKYLGLSFVPPVVEREISGTPGALQWFIDNVVRESERKQQDFQPANPEALGQAMDDLRVLLNLVNSPCDNQEDILIQKDSEKVYRVDFSEAFAPDKETIPGCEIRRCSRRLYKMLLDWDQDKVKLLISPFLNEEELRALDARRGSILWMIKKQIETRGEHAVLF
jgi:hypothetical protein